MIFRQLPHQKLANCHIKTYDFFLMVMTGVGNYAYRRPQDNVLVVPAGCLKD